MSSVKSPLILISFVGTAALAVAQPSPAPPAAPPPPPPVAKLTPPGGWVEDAAAATRIVAAVGGEAPFVGVPLSVDAQVWKAPSGGAALITSQVATEALPADPDAAATAALHDLRAGADAVTGAVVDAFAVVVDPAGKVHQANLSWRDPSVGTTTVARALVFRTGASLVRVVGECVVTADGAATRSACEAVLATLAPATTALEPLRVSATAPTAPAPDLAPRPDAPPAPTLSPRDADIPATLTVNPPKAQTDKRPYYLLAGIAVLGLVFWWNRRERERREAAERAEARRRERAERKAGAAPAKDDADDADDPKDADDSKGADGDDDARDPKGAAADDPDRERTP